jgi:hypothetical protein
MGSEQLVIPIIQRLKPCQEKIWQLYLKNLRRQAMLPGPYFICSLFSGTYNDTNTREIYLNIFTNIDRGLKIGLAGQKRIWYNHLQNHGSVHIHGLNKIYLPVLDSQKGFHVQEDFRQKDLG